MSQNLLVPIHLDVLRLTRRESLQGPTMAYERLPWYSAHWGRDVNADTPFMASAIVAPPLAGPRQTLEAGFHLHWSLPDALYRGELDHDTGKIVFPTVPNRWLIARILDGVETRWIVESDFVWPEMDAPKSADSPGFPDVTPAILLAHRMNGHGQPFQHVGRTYSWSEWQERPPGSRAGGGAAMTGPLTAAGHGDPFFAAYFPHCRSVFGFSDVWGGTLPELVEYRVVGWYADGAQDPLSGSTAGWEAHTDSSGQQTWKLPSHAWKVIAERPPTRTLCFASARVRGGPSPSPDPCVMAIAQTGTEALSALLAAELAGHDELLRARIEDQLEALHVRTTLASSDHDLAARLRIARHERGFRPIGGAPRWRLSSAGPAQEIPQALRQALDGKLRSLNDLEDQVRRCTLEHRAAQQALYTDWCMYMTVAYHRPGDEPGQYPEIDAARDHIERVHLRQDQTPAIPVVEEKARQIEALQRSVAARRAEMEDLIAAHLRALVEAGDLDSGAPTPFRLVQEPGPRFWKPNDPVVLLSGGGVRVTERHHQDGRGQTDGHLQCTLVSFTEYPWTSVKTDLAGLLATLAVPDEVDETRCTGFFEVKQRPWNPLFLEWAIDLYPADVTPLTRSGGHSRYEPEVVVKNYDIPPRCADLRPLVGVGIAADPDRFAGRCMLSTHAGTALLAQIENVLTRELLADYRPLHDTHLAEPFRDALHVWHRRAQGSAFYPDSTLVPAQHAALEEWYLTRPLGPQGATRLLDLDPDARFGDPLWTAIRALGRLFDGHHRRAFLSASLDGFNDELVGFASYPVLPIDEPIGFAPYRAFSAKVGALTGQQVLTPEPNNPYSPIRSGALEVSALHLVDTFGQTLKVAPDRVVGPARDSHGRHGAVYFPPRVLEELSVVFRWLDADLDHSQFTDTTGGTIICGWLVPSPTGGTITVFDQEGAGLGLLAVDRARNDVEWVPAPGQPAIARKPGVSSRERDLLQMDQAIRNPHLRRVVDHLWKGTAAHLGALIYTLVDAQENIDPESASEYGSLAMLLGRPLAVARAILDIEPLHDPASTRGDWIDFQRRIRGEARSDDGHDRVQFPVRLGEYDCLDDGTAGYWIETREGTFEDNCFYAQAADDVAELSSGGIFGDYRIQAHVQVARQDDANLRFSGRTMNLRRSIADDPLSVTLLLDPRGVVHLTTGILPTKVISIPPSSFARAIESMELWFQVGPLLARQGEHDLPLPAAPGYTVSWRESERIEADDDHVEWDDLRESPSVRADQVLEGLHQMGTSTTLDGLLAAGWLTPADVDGRRYLLTPRDRRGELGLEDSAIRQLEAWLERCAVQLGEVTTRACFERPSVAREGWLIFQQMTAPRPPS